MKHLHNKIRRHWLVLALLFGTGIAHAQTVAKTCIDYDPSSSTCKGGTITAARVPGESCQWTITAVPSSIGSFRNWTYDSDLVRIVSGSTTTKTITIEFIDPTLTDTIPCAAVFGYSVMHCDACGDFDIIDTAATSTVTYPHEADNMAQSTKSDWYGTIRATHIDESCWELYAVPKTGYTFAQWSDGVASNPRTIDIIDKDTVTYYASFISTNTLGKVDEWSADKLTITTDYDGGKGLIGNSALAYATRATVFYDGVLAGSSVPASISKSKGKDVHMGVYKLDANYTSAEDLAGKKCHIVFKNDDCEPLATLDTIIPYLVSGTVSVGKISSANKYGVHVLYGGLANFDAAQEIAELDIYSGGKAVINSAVEVSSVTIRADIRSAADAGELLVDGGSLTNANGNKIYYDCKVDLKDFYPFSLPATISTSEAFYRSGADVSDSYGLDIYDGDRRAQKTTDPSLTGWAPYYYDPADPQGITIGRGYNIFALPEEWNGVSQEKYGAHVTFPVVVNLSSGAMAAKTIDVEQNDDGGAADYADKNWNLIGSPYLSSYQGNIMMLDGDDNEIDYLNYIIYSEDNFQTYASPENPSAFVIKPVQAYFVQVPDGIYKLRFETPVSGRAYAPRRANMNANDKLAAGLKLTQGDKSDCTGLLISESYTNDYDINADLVKMMGSKQGLSVFSLAGNQMLSYIALPPTEGLSTQETVIPLGYSKATVGGNMTFAFDEARYPSVRDDERIQALNLIDYAEGTMTDLLQDSYTCTATETANNERFALAIRYIKNSSNVATGICDDAMSTKMRDGVYDLMGRRINIDDARTLGAGVYVIIENGKARKEVIR